MLAEHGIKTRTSKPTFNAEHVQWMVREHLCVALIREHVPLHEELTTRPIRGVSWTVDSAIVYQAEGRQKTTSIMQYLHQIRARDESAIMYDPAMEYIKRFYDESATTRS
jgi:type IV secretion system coupling TraD/TrwB family protein